MCRYLGWTGWTALDGLCLISALLGGHSYLLWMLKGCHPTLLSKFHVLFLFFYFFLAWLTPEIEQIFIEQLQGWWPCLYQVVWPYSTFSLHDKPLLSSESRNARSVSLSLLLTSSCVHVSLPQLVPSLTVLKTRLLEFSSLLCPSGPQRVWNFLKLG